VDQQNGTINVFASMETVKNAPHKHEAEPISKQAEYELNDYYGWPHYWPGFGNNLPWGGFVTPLELANAHNDGSGNITNNNQPEHHLRSADEVKGSLFGYQIETPDGRIGQVDDLIIDEVNWKLTHLVVNTKQSLIDNYILISTDQVQSIDWKEKEITVRT
jgi:sporulation protein YlmC with PRC-barrel domain